MSSRSRCPCTHRLLAVHISFLSLLQTISFIPLGFQPSTSPTFMDVWFKSKETHVGVPPQSFLSFHFLGPGMSFFVFCFLQILFPTRIRFHFFFVLPLAFYFILLVRFFHRVDTKDIFLVHVPQPFIVSFSLVTSCLTIRYAPSKRLFLCGLGISAFAAEPWSRRWIPSLTLSFPLYIVVSFSSCLAIYRFVLCHSNLKLFEPSSFLPLSCISPLPLDNSWAFDTE